MNNNSCISEAAAPVAHVAARRANGMVEGTFALPGNTSAARYLELLSGHAAPAVEVPEPVRFTDAPQDAREPFLSVVMRTQGKRIEELTDVLLCLCAQQDEDFELIVIGHKVDPANAPDLLGLIASFPPSLLAKTAYYPVEYGNRTTPLQVGFTVARGRYVAALDDDDLVMDTWVSDFKELAREHDGKMLHTYVVTQEWGVLPGSADSKNHELAAQTAYNPSYCHDFDAASQLATNACPLMGLAFPRFVYQQLGIGFDETLSTTEDWDFLMRVYSVCGVASRDRVSAVYRLWTNAETSHTMHDTREWDKNYTAITDKMNAHPYLLDAGSVEDVRSKSPFAPTSRDALAGISTLLLFGDVQDKEHVDKQVRKLHEGKYSELKADYVTAVSGGTECDLSFRVPEGDPLQMIAFTPLAAGFKVLGEFSMTLVEANGASTTLDFANRAFDNGQQVDCNHIVYLKEHPYVAFKLPHAMRLARVDFTFKLLAHVPDFYIDQVTLGKAGLVFGRGLRWLKRKVNKHV